MSKALKKYKYHILIGTTLAILILIGSLILPLMDGQPLAVHFLKKYEKWVKKNVEIDKIQEWLISGEADKYMNERYIDNFPDDLPEFMTSSNPRYIFFNDQESDREKSIEILYGGSALDHHGIVIGLPTSDTQQDGVIKESESYWEYRRSIKPGIYIYDGG